MKRKSWILIVLFLVLIVLLISLWQYKAFKNNKLKVMCKSSINAALEHFNEYCTSQQESDYMAGVAEFRTYMTSYISLEDESSDTDYLWCNTLYGYMVMNPKKIKQNIPELVKALEYLAEVYDHPNGFNLINALNNKIGAENTK